MKHVLVEGVQIGMLRQIDEKSRIYLPKELLEMLKISKGDYILIGPAGDGDIFIHPLKKNCFFCGEQAGYLYKRYPVCSGCLTELKQGVNLKENRDINLS